jgi:hypothetical protein
MNNGHPLSLAPPKQRQPYPSTWMIQIPTHSSVQHNFNKRMSKSTSMGIQIKEDIIVQKIFCIMVLNKTQGNTADMKLVVLGWSTCNKAQSVGLNVTFKCT